MLQEIIICIIAVCILLLPLSFWMYAILHFETAKISRKEFMIWVASGGLLSLLFVYWQDIFIWVLLENIFSSLFNIKQNYWATFFLNIWVFFSVYLWSIIVILLGLKLRVKTIYIQSLQVLIYFLSIIFILSILSWLSVTFFADTSSVRQSFGLYSFLTLWSIIAYYFTISILEEWTKYFSSFWVHQKHNLISFSDFVLISVCVALGFSFFENILYAVSYAKNQGIDISILHLILMRSIFSVVLHVLCSLSLSIWFWHILYGDKKMFSSLILFGIFAFLSLLSHAFFDISLSYGLLWLIFLYVPALYVLMSYVVIEAGKTTWK